MSGNFAGLKFALTASVFTVRTSVGTIEQYPDENEWVLLPDRQNHCLGWAVPMLDSRSAFNCISVANDARASPVPDSSQHLR
jgi:hypothetical protein